MQTNKTANKNVIVSRETIYTQLNRMTALLCNFLLFLSSDTSYQKRFSTKNKCQKRLLFNVDLRRLELLTSSMPWRRSTN